MSGQSAVRRWTKTRLLAVPVAALMGLVLTIPAQQPAGASPVKAADGARAVRVGSLPSATVADKLDVTGELQSALLKFAANKLAGFGFGQLGLDKLLNGTEAQFEAFQTQLSQISQQLGDLKKALDTIKGDIDELKLDTFTVHLTGYVDDIKSLYINKFAPALRSLTQYVSDALAAKALGQKCDADPCLTAKNNYYDDIGLFFKKYTDGNAEELDTHIHGYLLPGALDKSVMSAFGAYMATHGPGWLNANDSDTVRGFYNYFADYEALAAWMLAEYNSYRFQNRPDEFDIFLNQQVYGYQDEEHAALPPRIPPGTVIMLPKSAVDRTGNTRNLPMWGAPNTRTGILPYGSLGWWDPYDNAVGVPALVRSMNSQPALGWGFQDWRLPSRAELDALLSRGAADQTASQFLFSMNPDWDGLLSSDLSLAPYIWTTQPSGVPSWDGSPEIPCEDFNALAGGYVTIVVFKDYLHTAVGPVTNSLSGYPAGYRNYNRPAGSLKKITIDVPSKDPLDKKLAACTAALKDDISKAFAGGAGSLKTLATTMTIRSTGNVNYLP